MASLNTVTPPIKIWLLSDFHSELLVPHKACKALSAIAETVKESKDCRKALFIAGDLGNPRAQTFPGFLEILKDAFDVVIGVAGNHEYYRVTRDRVSILQIDECLHAAYAKAGCTFLQCEETTLFGKKRVVGATLWSDINYESFAGLNDSVHVFDDMKDYLGLHKAHTAYLEKALGDDNPLVITHHLPTFKAIHPVYRCKSCNEVKEECRHGINPGFATDLDHLIKRSEKWFCGHTHESFYTQGVALNPYGYAGERKLTKWLNMPLWAVSSQG
jgi:predicted MPP superfamily phosphohydrolase